ncbi:MAG: hypothetical protein JJ863_38035 [Deltaproteobacteria bacterium]|nr:hypothetical protein [Deltaproteobacteria bacterium]
MLRRRTVRPAAAMGALLALLAAAPAAAQGEIECPSTEVGPLDFTPASRALGVTLDAYIRVRYSEDYFVGVPDAGTFVRLYEDLDEDEGFVELGPEVPGEGQLVGDDVYFVPDELLASDRQYAIVAESFELEPIAIDFTTGRDLDREPPRIGSVGAPTTESVDETCGRGAGYRVDLVVRDVRDDGPASSIELLVYLARQEGLEAPELVLRARGTGAAEQPLGFVLTDERANDPACVVVHAVDGVGNVDDSMEPVCFEPIQGAFFEGLCAANRIAGAPTGGKSGSIVLIALALILVVRRRSH